MSDARERAAETLPEPAPLMLAGQSGLVLGVSRRASVGYHCARTFRSMGAEVAITQRGREPATERELESELGVLALPMNVLDEHSVADAFAALAQRRDRLDFLVHCLVHVPPGGLSGSALEISRDDFSEAMEVGARSLLVCARHALPLLRRSEAPRIVALFSAGGEFAIPNYHLVGIVKGALAATLRYLALELGPLGVLCNGVSFPMLETGAAERVLGKETVEKTRNHLGKRSMTRTPGTFESVANTVAFLVSRNCQNLTGEIINVDGGYCRSYF